MDISRIMYLRDVNDDESLSYGEIAEIEEAFALIPDSELRDLRENALASDMLDELEAQVSPIERRIYDWVVEHFGESEANDPGWSISALAEELNDMPVGVGAEERTLGELLGAK